MGPVKDSIVKPGKLDENSILNKHLEYFTRYGVKCMIRCNEPKYDAEMYARLLSIDILEVTDFSLTVLLMLA